ncbi:MAG: hypothetical protein R6W88_14440 [Desulfobacterales bacterium]
MKRAAVVTLCFILSLFADTSLATEVTLFGPNQYVRTSGAPDIYTGSFTAISGEGTLIVKNGAIDGTDRITEAISIASVYVNGEQIFGPSDFNQNVYLFQSPVSLLGNNSITVELASGPGSYLTIEIKQEQQQEQPEVSLSADPGNITAGESAVLTWSSTNADTCEIDQGVGSVNANGSVSVSPVETTTYKITAAGLGGTVTDSVTITVSYPAPAVSIIADPETIPAGGSSTLTWNSTYADSAVIDKGIGSVASNGSVTVSPAETTTYTITVTGPGGTATESVTVNVSSLDISITSPGNGNTITQAHIMVRGTVANPLGNEVGVNVNGIIAMVYGDQFVANHVLLIEGENTITALTTDAAGNTARSSITITAQPTERFIRIRAITESGVSPLETTLEVDGSFSFTESSISYTGPGKVEIVDGTDDNEYNVKMTETGIYFFTAEVTNDQNNLYTATIAVCVFDEGQLDVLLREKWNGMKAALGNGDIDGALAYFAKASKDNYQKIFTSLTKDRLQGIVSEMREIEKIDFGENRAKYGINREETIKGVVHDITHYIFFVKDGRGLWKIESF